MASLRATNGSNTDLQVSVTRLVTYGLIAVILTSLVNGLVRTIALTVFDVPNVFALWWEPVLVASAVGAIGATIVYGLLTRVSNRPNRIFTIAAVTVLALSFAGPIGALLAPPPELADAPWTVFATLIAMHVTAATTIVGVLTRAPTAEVELP